MYDKICRRISKHFVLHKIIAQDDMEVFEFGLERILSTVVSSVMIGIFGILFQAILECIIFVFCFYYSRKYAGGYHAKTYTKCNACYIATFLLTIIISRCIENSMSLNIILVMITIITLSTTVLLAPINNPNNPILPEKENRFFAFAVLINVLFVFLASLIQLFSVHISVFIFVTLFMSAVYMHIEIIVRRERGMTKIFKTFGEKVVKLAMRNAKGSVREVSKLGVYQAKRPAILDKDSKK